MTINIRQNKTTLMTEGRQIINSITNELYVLTPADGKAIKNISTGEIFQGFVYVKNKEQIKNYIEINLE